MDGRASPESDYPKILTGYADEVMIPSYIHIAQIGTLAFACVASTYPSLPFIPATLRT